MCATLSSMIVNTQDLIDNAIQQWSDQKEAERDTEHFACSDAGLCYRSRFLKRLGVPSTRVTPVGALRKMMAGEAAHEKLQAVLKASGQLESAEETLSLWPDVLGHYDAVVREGDERILLEFKTIEKWQMGHIKKDGPKPQHILQMFTYWFQLRAQPKETKNLNQATLIYVQREDYQQVQFDYLWDKEIAGKTLAEWLPLFAYWKNQQLPPCSCGEDFDGNGMKYCRYQARDGESCCDPELVRMVRV